MGGGWAIDTGTYQTPNMDMRRHIKEHQTPNINTSKDFKEKPKPTSKHSKAYYIRNHPSCHSTFGSKAHSLRSKSGSKETFLEGNIILPCAEGNIRYKIYCLATSFDPPTQSGIIYIYIPIP